MVQDETRIKEIVNQAVSEMESRIGKRLNEISKVRQEDYEILRSQISKINPEKIIAEVGDRILEEGETTIIPLENLEKEVEKQISERSKELEITEERIGAYSNNIEEELKKAKRKVSFFSGLGKLGFTLTALAFMALGAGPATYLTYKVTSYFFGRIDITPLEASLRKKIDPSKTLLIKLDENEWPEKVERDKNEYPLIVTRDFTHPFKEKKVEYLHDRTTAERIKNLISENEPYKP